MAMTYGEEMLALAEHGQRARSARARRRTVMYPALGAIAWALADLVAARHERLLASGAGLVTMVIDHALPIVWTIMLVLIPMVLALKPHPLPVAGVLAFFAGPVMSPVLFGAGGWNWWQSLLVTVAAAMVLSAALMRARARRT